jgi:uncharacterized peroxidase-related enzyme
MNATLTPVDPATATGAARELLDQVQRALGTTPNMTKVMANSPALLRGYLALSGALATGALKAPVREQLAIATAEVNGCGYCLSAHTYLGGALGKLPDSELAAARDAKSADPHTAALLALSDEILRNQGSLSQDAIPTARAAGVTDEEIGEVVAHIALNVLTNYFNVLATVENDWPVAVVPRQPRLSAAA